MNLYVLLLFTVTELELFFVLLLTIILVLLLLIFLLIFKDVVDLPFLN